MNSDHKQLQDEVQALRVTVHKETGRLPSIVYMGPDVHTLASSDDVAYRARNASSKGRYYMGMNIITCGQVGHLAVSCEEFTRKRS